MVNLHRRRLSRYPLSQLPFERFRRAIHLEGQAFQQDSKAPLVPKWGLTFELGVVDGDILVIFIVLD